MTDEPRGAGSGAGEQPDARDEALVAALRAADPDVPTVIFMRYRGPEGGALAVGTLPVAPDDDEVASLDGEVAQPAADSAGVPGPAHADSTQEADSDGRAAYFAS